MPKRLATTTEDILDILSHNDSVYNVIINQKLEVLKQFHKHMDNHERVLVVSHDIYAPQSAAVVTIDKLYNSFALGHIDNRVTGVRIPYTITYASVIAHDYAIKSVWEGETQKQDKD